MIRYALKCANDHDFESWFAGDKAFGSLQGAGQLSCPICGSDQVQKAVMAPAVRPARSAAGPGPAGTLSKPQTEVELALAEMRRQVEANSDYVGLNFVTEARAMHAGETPERPIHGEAKFEDAKALLEEGVPIAPLPFMPPRKTN